MVSAADPYVKRWGDVADATRGDVHYYNYEDDCEDEDIYPTARFVSEFAISRTHLYRPTSTPFLPKGRDQHLANAQSFYPSDSDIPTETPRCCVSSSVGSTFQQKAAKVKSHRLRLRLWAPRRLCTSFRCSSPDVTTAPKWRRGDGGGGESGAGHNGGVILAANDVWAGPTWSSVEHGVGAANCCITLSVAPSHLAISVTSVTKKKKTKKIIKKQNKKKVVAMVGRVLEEDEEEVVELWSTCECGAGASAEGWTADPSGQERRR